MKLVSFAVVSFLAATVSAGFSAAFGNADYNAHQLEKRDPGEDRQKQLKEEIEQDQKHYKDVREEYLGMKNREGELEDDLFRLKFELQNEGHKSPGGGLSDRYNKARLLYNDQQKACYEKYELMMKLKEALQKKQLLSTSIAHLMVECEQVAGHRIQSGLVPAIQKSRLRLLGRALDPGVENVYTWLRGGVLNGEADLDQRWLDGTVEHESMGTRHDNRALAARLADSSCR
ncbi:hypothetical protein BASA62_004045 [Batrachochytrium salamandrivorans]|nr:hypothetical protein BASA62_004045 [Batrachochytrium salamandrivorans]